MRGQLVLLTAPPPSFQSHDKAKPFHKKGFPLFNKISNLINGTHTTGVTPQGLTALVGVLSPVLRYVVDTKKLCAQCIYI